MPTPAITDILTDDDQVLPVNSWKDSGGDLEAGAHYLIDLNTEFGFRTCFFFAADDFFSSLSAATLGTNVAIGDHSPDYRLLFYRLGHGDARERYVYLGYSGSGNTRNLLLISTERANLKITISIQRVPGYQDPMDLPDQGDCIMKLAPRPTATPPPEPTAIPTPEPTPMPTPESTPTITDILTDDNQVLPLNSWKDSGGDLEAGAHYVIDLNTEYGFRKCFFFAADDFFSDLSAATLGTNVAIGDHSPDYRLLFHRLSHGDIRKRYVYLGYSGSGNTRNLLLISTERANLKITISIQKVTDNHCI